MRKHLLCSTFLLPLLLSACALFPGAGGAVARSATVAGLVLAPDSPRFLVCGHRGDLFGSLLQGGDNTIDSFDRAVQCGADLVEIDVQNTLDAVPVVSHDQDVTERTYLEPGEAGDPPLPLARVLRWARDRVVLILDLKAKEIAPAVAVVRAESAEDRVVFYAGNLREYEDVRALGSDLFLMVRARKPGDLAPWCDRVDPGIILIHVDYDWMTPELVRQIHASGRRVFANSYKATWHQELFGAGGSVRSLFELGIDIAQTNHPAGASRARDEALGRR